MKRQIKWFVAVIFVIAMIGYFVYSSVKPLETELLKVEAQTVAQTFTEEGIVKAAVERPVYSVINGTIKQLVVKEGDELKKGELLIELEAKELEYQLEQLKGQLKSIQGQERQANRAPFTSQIKQQQLVIEDIKRQLKISEENYEKMAKLYENGAVSKTELDSAKQQLERQENNLKQQEQGLKLIEEQTSPLPGTDQYYQGLTAALEAQIKQIEYGLNNRMITAPISGMVTNVNVKEGAVITPQTPLLTMTTTEDFEVDVNLLTEDVVNVKEGMRVTLTQERKAGDVQFSGVVKTIAPTAEEQISTLGLTQQKVRVTIAPGSDAPRLRPGYALDVLFTTDKQENKLAVPNIVLFPYGNGDALWVVKSGKAAIQQVEKGMETNELVVIEKGLQAGDLVIKNPQLEGLKEGKKITAK